MIKNNIIEFNHYSFSYDGDTKILRDITFNIEEGERVLILGPSGCGKSTLTLSINGIIPQLIEGKVEGNIKVKKMDVLKTPVSTLTQHVGIVFQDPESQFCMLKLEDEIAFGLENLMVERGIIRKKIEKSLQNVGLSSYQKEMLDRLSGGMKQRAAIASLLAIDQEILIFDEPTSNLDPQGTREVSNIIRRLPFSKTLIIIEHKLDEFIDIFDKVLLLNRNGSVIAFSSTEDIFLNHQTELQKLGVWIPQIPKYVYKLYENNIKLDHFPLNRQNVAQSIKEMDDSEDRRRSLNILKTELKKYLPNSSDKKNTLLAPEKCVIKVENLHYKFKKSSPWVLKDINFSINSGDFVGIAGHNGSGKTTLAKLLVSLYKPEPPSKISIFDPASKDNIQVPENKILKFTGFVFQNPEHQFVEDSVYKEVMYGASLKYQNENLAKHKVEEILKLLDLEKLKDRNPFNLSQGQKRKLSVASIMVMNQQILILDEPTFGLDYITTTNLMKLLLNLNNDGKTIIIITHDMNMIFKYTKKVLILKEGKLIFSGNTRNLLEESQIIRPSHLSVPPIYQLYKDVSSYAVF